MCTQTLQRLFQIIKEARRESTASSGETKTVFAGDGPVLSACLAWAPGVDPSTNTHHLLKGGEEGGGREKRESSVKK